MSKFETDTGNTNLKALGVDQILKLDPEVIRKGFRGKVNVIMSDSTLVPMNEEEIYINRHIWELAIEFTDSYITGDMTITKYYNKGTLTSGSINDSISAIAKFLIRRLVEAGEFKKTSLVDFSDAVIEVIDILHNDVSYKFIGHVTVIDMIDFLDLQLDKMVLEAMIKVKKNPSEITVSKAYKCIDDYMYRNRKTGLAMMFFTGALKPAQIHTLVGPVGGKRDINGIAYPDVVTNSYLMGLTKASWYFQESRATAKAAIQSKEAIQDSDTLAKSIQIISAVLSSITNEDCGSKEYRKVYVTPDNGEFKSNLPTYVGKVYLNEETNKLQVVQEGDTHLINTTIKIRSVSHCRTKNKHHVCMTCFGTLGLNLGPHVNIGHLAITILTAIVTQFHLSFKHHIGSAFGVILTHLTEELERYFNINPKDSGLRLKDQSSKDYETFIVIPQEAINVLTNDPQIMRNVDEMASSVVKTLSFKTSYVRDGEYADRTNDTIRVLNDGKTGYFSNEFLAYAAVNVLYDGKKKEFHINMANWNYDDNLMYILDKEYNFMELINELKILTMLNKTKKNNNVFLTLDSFIDKLTQVINKRMKVNVAWIEAFAYPFMRKLDSGELVRGDEAGVIEGRNILNHRSIAAASAHDDFTSKVTNPLLFHMKPVDHPADPLFRADQFFPVRGKNYRVKY